MIGRAGLVLCFIAVAQRSFVEPAPTGNAELAKPDIKNIDEEKQLKDLKDSFGKSFSVMKTQSFQTTDVNGQQESHGRITEEVNRDGQVIASVKQTMDTPAHEGGDHGGPAPVPLGHVHTEVDIPSRGIHRVEDRLLGDADGQQEVVENVERRGSYNNENNNVEKLKSFSNVQYSPLDMAEYVFWTGDEKGVTLSIEELLQDGLMTREEAIAFLQEIRLNLDELQAHYSQQQRLHKNEDQPQSEQTQDKTMAMQNSVEANKPHSTLLDSKPMNEVMMKKNFPKLVSTPPAITQEEMIQEARDIQQQKQQLLVMQQQQLQQLQQRTQQTQSQPTNLGISEEDYDELLERLKVADFLYTEYSLEEVIYQLAKVMFSQSLNKGSIGAQESLQKFTNFLEGEVEKGHISRSLEKKVLDVLIASLTDTLTEHPQLLSDVRESSMDSAPSTQLLHQLVMMNPAAKSQKTEDGHQSTLAKGRDKEQYPDMKNPKQDPIALEPISKAT